ncbi:MAG: hypothetical protein AAB874_05090 [Patescibacteria group bacterium]
MHRIGADQPFAQMIPSLGLLFGYNSKTDDRAILVQVPQTGVWFRQEPSDLSWIEITAAEAQMYTTLPMRSYAEATQHLRRGVEQF